MFKQTRYDELFDMIKRYDQCTYKFEQRQEKCEEIKNVYLYKSYINRYMYFVYWLEGYPPMLNNRKK